jgi:type VI secretion system secreted protein Hcp
MATDMFLKLEGVSGESADSKHKSEIDIESFQFGVAQMGSSASGGGAGSGKASFSDITFVKRADKSTPVLMQMCATGEPIKKANVTVRKAGGEQQEYYMIEMTNVIISSFQNSGSGGYEAPMESINLNFETFSLEYKEQKEDGGLGGTTKRGYNIKKNEKI